MLSAGMAVTGITTITMVVVTPLVRRLSEVSSASA